MERNFDVVIVGGGPVGLTLASALVRSMPGIGVALIERRSVKAPVDHRSFALSAGVSRIFQALGIWDQMISNAAPINRMSITDSAGKDISRPQFLAFEGDVTPGEPFAHMVPNVDLVGALLDGIGEGVAFFEEEEVVSVDIKGGYREVCLKSGQTLHAQLVVASDGARSQVRDMVGIDVFKRAYGQSGIVTTISHAKPHEETAFEHFRPQGPFASLPLFGNRSSLVWTVASEKVEAIMAMEKSEQEEMIGQETGWSLGEVTIDQDLQAFPLSLQLAKKVIGDRVAIVGDAAHVIHPIAGQGLNLGLQDVAELAELIVEHIRLGLDYGLESNLQSYQHARRIDTGLMALSTDGLNRLFSNDISWLRSLRDVGLGVVDRVDPLKSALIRHAAAVRAQAPKLMRGQLI